LFLFGLFGVRWRDGEMTRWRDGAMARWSDEVNRGGSYMPSWPTPTRPASRRGQASRASRATVEWPRFVFARYLSGAFLAPTVRIWTATPLTTTQICADLAGAFAACTFRASTCAGALKDSCFHQRFLMRGSASAFQRPITARPSPRPSVAICMTALKGLVTMLQCIPRPGGA